LPSDICVLQPDIVFFQLLTRYSWPENARPSMVFLFEFGRTHNLIECIPWTTTALAIGLSRPKKAGLYVLTLTIPYTQFNKMDSKLKIMNPQEMHQFKLIVQWYSRDTANCLWGRKTWRFSCQVRLLRFSLLAQQTNLQP